ncbi:PilZ domain-containing protein [Simiduia aestuariiviva]|uniref:C-di-GMP-binding flagellar brake protein YcgR n=1 Tax=Simiduia aestuariiviva TaxID=1510459 RepID=A0A839UKC4_9GAMM|nr:PilZ domain-containing protein [Simiduia aestuariiviva]MBB3167060.1 c-di-GMP-binding flagellar brake protein YcgR [Simiduia aestuariiviva]
MSERRRFFRINDRVGVAYRVLTDAEADSRQERDNEPMDTMSLLSRYENTIEALLPQVDSEVLVELLGTLNKKINCVVAQLELDSRLVRDIAHKVREVNISACGMAFVADEHVPPGKVLSLDLLLRPEGTHLATYGQVLDCQSTDAGHYLRVNFMSLSPYDQEVLIQHIVRKQGWLIREQRDRQQMEASSELQHELQRMPVKPRTK